MDPAKAAVFAEEIAAVLAMKPEPKPKRKAGDSPPVVKDIAGQ
jgi:hypothetical protein